MSPNDRAILILSNTDVFRNTDGVSVEVIGDRAKKVGPSRIRALLSGKVPIGWDYSTVVAGLRPLRGIVAERTWISGHFLSRGYHAPTGILSLGLEDRSPIDLPTLYRDWFAAIGESRTSVREIYTITELEPHLVGIGKSKAGAILTENINRIHGSFVLRSDDASPRVYWLEDIRRWEPEPPTHRDLMGALIAQFGDSPFSVDDVVGAGLANDPAEAGSRLWQLTNRAFDGRRVVREG